MIHPILWNRELFPPHGDFLGKQSPNSFAPIIRRSLLVHEHVFSREKAAFNILVKLVWMLALVFILGGCQRANRTEVVVYCALDREYAEPVLQQFERETGIHVRALYDVEATKTVGLAERLRRESPQPRADVFWNNEVLHSQRLAREGILVPYATPAGAEYAKEWRAADDSWHGFAARARVLLVNTQKWSQANPNHNPPKTLDDLTDARWKGQLGIAKPLFGTTATQIACLWVQWGPERTIGWLRRMRANRVQIVAGNKQVAVAVGSGQLSMGLTDTDDALAEIRAGHPVQLYYLDDSPEGALVLPNTVGLVAGCRHGESARRLIDYLLSARIEEMLARGPSGQIPLHPQARQHPRLPPVGKTMTVDYEAVAKAWENVARAVRDEFAGP